MKRDIKLKVTNSLLQILMWILYVILVIYTISIVAALVWALFSSFKDMGDYTLHPFSLPKTFILDNYSIAWRELKVRVTTATTQYTVKVYELIFNSIVYSITSAAISTFSVVFTAYACIRYPKFFLSKFLYSCALIFMVIPLGTSDLASTFSLYRLFGIQDNFIGVMFTKAGFVGFNFILFHSTFKGLGKEYFEASCVDGANNLQILFKIMLPMIANIIAIIFVMAFVGYWNDWTTSYLYLPSMPTVSYGLYLSQFSSDTEAAVEPVRLAASLIVCLPGLLMFFIFRNQMMNSSLTVSGIKG